MIRRRPQDVRNLIKFFNSFTGCTHHCTPSTSHKHSFTTDKIQSNQFDYAFEFKSSNLRFGQGVTAEVGYDLQNMRCKNVLIVTDPHMVNLQPTRDVLDSITSVNQQENASIKYQVYDQATCEPTDISFQKMIDFARKGNYDSFLAVGGGSVMDTCKVGNLFATHRDYELFDFVNAPLGKGLPVPGPLRPMIAIPTTTGTGSETTGVAIFDIVEQSCKTGIGNRLLTPSLALVDPNHAMYQPAGLVTASGFDVLCHALESYTAISFNDRSPRPKNPKDRPAYQGSNPIADVWCEISLPILEKYFFRAVENQDDFEARMNMQYASCFAGMGFGTAGCHLCHGMSYPISGLAHHREYVYPDFEHLNQPIIPHGVSVVVSAPSVFDFTCSAKPDKHSKAAKMLGVPENQLPTLGNEFSEDSIDLIANKLHDKLLGYMERLKIPNGLKDCGFSNSDIDDLVKGTIPQERVTKLSPIPIDPDILGGLFEKSMKYY